MSSESQPHPLTLKKGRSDADSDQSKPSNLDRYLTEKILHMSGSPRIEIQLWDDSSVTVSESPPIAKMHIKSRNAFRSLLFDGDIGFGDCYSNGEIEVVGDLTEFLCEVYSGQHKRASKANVFGRFVSWRQHRKTRVNTLEGSKANIHHHYDLGNKFYSLWLDREAMQYTCAYFPRPDLTIEQAQIAKMEHVSRKLQLKPGQRVVEAGCGWGGLALYMAKVHGVKVKSYNISHEQIIYAQERAKKLGMQDQVEYIEDDYRNFKGEYDVFVSGGMVEHVGMTHYTELGAVINRCLSPNGRALIHSIGRNLPALMNAWIEKRIFPGAYPPTIREMMDICEPYNFSVLDIENLRLHYAETLRHWLERFKESEENIVEMFDERFARAWQLYLVGSIAAFQYGSLQLFQMVLARGEDNTIPASREHQYQEPLLL